ncbi:MAG TPA: stage III sporulation protein AD [Symbiobacteriaceae bacterium]|nr:stage III sporulation protein AD [Symbiobacteriaceae bacterium]
MEIVKIVGIGLLAGMLIILIKQKKPELAFGLSIATTVLIFMLMLVRIFQVIDFMQALGARAKVDATHMSTVLKIIGIAYVTDFGSQVLQDSGEKAVASKVEMAGKVIIILMSVPIMMAILDTVLRLLG